MSTVIARTRKNKTTVEGGEGRRGETKERQRLVESQFSSSPVSDLSVPVPVPVSVMTSGWSGGEYSNAWFRYHLFDWDWVWDCWG